MADGEDEGAGTEGPRESEKDSGQATIRWDTLGYPVPNLFVLSVLQLATVPKLSPSVENSRCKKPFLTATDVARHFHWSCEKFVHLAAAEITAGRAPFKENAVVEASSEMEAETKVERQCGGNDVTVVEDSVDIGFERGRGDEVEEFKELLYFFEEPCDDAEEGP
ncbi:hypothetical protein BDK51DRAFT_27659 [Blyttiomyces helicus]|uniref:Uncharacterized protein n=1 Tax=Blyttiomyces helicus TaxID=388810 RepID=A0A4P9W7A0_9FUNG|nr:hypothetical protein BDK51DRAFT_27659 [Blyttiomyces helicus]|eukprot:RKO86640.1 hypothetical protein BDK51DRAFT_27659 [Blyttiomyces helicus]